MATKIYKLTQKKNVAIFDIPANDGKMMVTFTFKDGNQFMPNMPARCMLRNKFYQDLLERSDLFKRGVVVLERTINDEEKTEPVETPKKKQALPKFLSLEESLELLKAVKNDTESKTMLRDYAIITLFLNCGMRVSELVGIDLEDVDSQLRSLTVTGKGNKQRIVYLNDACKIALADHIDERCGEKHKNCPTRALFLSNREQRISVKTVQWLVYKYLDMAGLESKHYSVHKLRHTAATLMYQTGNVDVRVLKDILGHEQLNTTQIYTHVSNRSMEEAMESNPLSTLGGVDDDNDN
jgi:site-specific recombinase XerD